MRYTLNLNLAKPDRGDTIDVENQISNNMQKIDDAYGSLEQHIAFAQNGSLATQNIPNGSYFTRNKQIYIAKTDINSGEQFSTDNCEIADMNQNGLVNHFNNLLNGFQLCWKYEVQNGEAVFVDLEFGEGRVKKGVTYLVVTSSSDLDYFSLWIVYANDNFDNRQYPKICRIYTAPQHSTVWLRNVEFEYHKLRIKDERVPQMLTEGSFFVYIYKIGQILV